MNPPRRTGDERRDEDAQPERRARQRREEDVEQSTIVRHAVQDAPLVHRLLQMGKVAAACSAIGLVIGGTSSAMIMRFVTAPQTIAANSQRIGVVERRQDSLAFILRAMQQAQEQIQQNQEIGNFMQCVQAKPTVASLRKWCDAVEARMLK